MEVLAIIASIIFIVIIISVSIKINDWSFEKYDYKPFNLAVFSLMFLSVIIFFIGQLLLPEKFEIFIRHLLEFNIDKTALNSLVLFILGVLIIIATWIHVSLKTNFFIGTYAIIIQLGLSTILVILVFFWFIWTRSKKAEQQKK